MKFPQAREPSKAVGDRGKPVVGHPKLNQALHVRDSLRDRLECVLAEVQVAQLRKLPKRLRQRGQSVVVQIEKVGQATEVAQCVRQPRKLVVTEIEHTQLLQTSNAVRKIR